MKHLRSTQVGIPSYGNSVVQNGNKKKQPITGQQQEGNRKHTSFVPFNFSARHICKRGRRRRRVYQGNYEKVSFMEVKHGRSGFNRINMVRVRKRAQEESNTSNESTKVDDTYLKTSPNKKADLPKLKRSELESMHFQNLFTREEEEIASWIVEVGRIGYRICRQDVLFSYKTMLEEKKQENPFADNLPTSFLWYKGFQDRHPHINSHLLQGTKSGCFEVSAAQVGQWFSDFQQYLGEKIPIGTDKLMSDPSRWFVMDVAAFLVSQKCKQGKLETITVGSYDELQHYVKKQMRGLTVLACMSADGHYPYPMGLVKNGNCLCKVPELKYLSLNIAAWMNYNLFRAWLEDIFIPDLEVRGVIRPVVLLIDGTSQFLSFQIWCLCKEKGIILYCFEKWDKTKQPCYMEFFPLLTKHLHKRFNELKTSIQNRVNGIQDATCTLVSLFDKVWGQTIKSEGRQLAAKTFQKMGIYPMNPKIGQSRFKHSSPELDPSLLGLTGPLAGENLGRPAVVIENVEEVAEDIPLTSRRLEHMTWRTKRELNKYPPITKVFETSGSMLRHSAATYKTKEGTLASNVQMAVVDQSEIGNFSTEVPLAVDNQNKLSSTAEEDASKSTTKLKEKNLKVEKKSQTVLTKEEENLLINFITELAKIGYRAQHYSSVIKEAVKCILDENKREVSFVNNMPGSGWLNRFRYRYPVVGDCMKSHQVDSSKLTEEHINVWFNDFIKFLQKNIKDEEINSDPTRWYMLDEACFIVKAKGSALETIVMAPKIASKWRANKQRSFVTLACMCADGHYLEPMIVMKNVDGYKPSMTKHVMLGLASYEGLDQELFLAWLEDAFISDLNEQGVKRPVILLIHGKTYISYKIWCFCKENQIILYCLEKWETNKQPCHMEFFPLVAKTLTECLQDSGNNGLNLHQMISSKFLTTIDTAWRKAVEGSAETAVKAFREMGIFPLNQKIGSARFKTAYEYCTCDGKPEDNERNVEDTCGTKEISETPHRTTDTCRETRTQLKRCSVLLEKLDLSILDTTFKYIIKPGSHELQEAARNSTKSVQEEIGQRSEHFLARSQADKVLLNSAGERDIQISGCGVGVGTEYDHGSDGGSDLEQELLNEDEAEDFKGKIIYPSINALVSTCETDVHGCQVPVKTESVDLANSEETIDLTYPREETSTPSLQQVHEIIKVETCHWGEDEEYPKDKKCVNEQVDICKVRENGVDVENGTGFTSVKVLVSNVFYAENSHSNGAIVADDLQNSTDVEKRILATRLQNQTEGSEPAAETIEEMPMDPVVSSLEDEDSVPTAGSSMIELQVPLMAGPLTLSNEDGSYTVLIQQ